MHLIRIQGNVHIGIRTRKPTCRILLLGSNATQKPFIPCRKGITKEGFHVTSYQANFASHCTFDRHDGFLFVWRGIGKHKEMSRNFY